jgi:hypothetical protein
MSFRCPSRCWSALVVLQLSEVLVCCALGADNLPAPKPETSRQNNAAALTNLTDLGGRKDRLGRLEEELNRSFKGVSFDSSLDAVRPDQIRPAPRPVIQSKRIQELLDRRKDWIFMTPEEIMAGSTGADPSKMPEYGPDGQPLKKLSPMERFYEGLNHRDAGGPGTAAGRQRDPFGLRNDGAPLDSLTAREEEEKLPNSVRQSEQKLQKLLGADTGSGVSAPMLAHGSLSDIFGLGGDSSFSPEQVRAHEDYMKRYQELLNGPAPVSSMDPLNPLGGGAAAQTGGLVGAYGSSRPSVFESSGGLPDPTRVPSPSADMNAKVLNQWNLMQAQSLPTLAPPMMAQPPPAIVEFPRRKF